MAQKKMKIYISGPISGLERGDYMRRFTIAERKLQASGYQVCNPTRLLPCRHLWIYRLIGYRLTLLYDLWHMLRCDGFVMLPGWSQSRGGKIEYSVATIYGLMNMIDIDVDLENRITDAVGAYIYDRKYNPVNP